MIPDTTDPTMAQVQRLRDEFARGFAALVTQAEDLAHWAQDHPNVDLGDARAQLAFIGGFADWANTPTTALGGKSPDRYYRGIRSLGV